LTTSAPYGTFQRGRHTDPFHILPACPVTGFAGVPSFLRYYAVQHSCSLILKQTIPIPPPSFFKEVAFIRTTSFFNFFSPFSIRVVCLRGSLLTYPERVLTDHTYEPLFSGPLSALLVSDFLSPPLSPSIPSPGSLCRQTG